MVARLIWTRSRLVSVSNLSSPSRSNTIHDLGEDRCQTLRTDLAADLPDLEERCDLRGFHLVGVDLRLPMVIPAPVPFRRSRIADLRW
jgi:hypothetical protein